MNGLDRFSRTWTLIYILLLISYVDGDGHPSLSYATLLAVGVVG